MKVSFVKALGKVLNSEKAMLKQYGQLTAPLKRRLAVLVSEPNLDKVSKGPPERCHELTANRRGEFAITIKDKWRLILVPDHDPIPRRKDGGIDLKSVTDVLVTEVSNHYE
jgi:plasmid maintenance system killer protein